MIRHRSMQAGWIRPVLWVLLCILLAGRGQASAAPGSMDERLAAAKRLVLGSDKYLYHLKLRRGMTGYGLTVMAGTKISRFNVEIVSVMTDFGPHQDVILAKLSGLGLKKSGIIAGMSGSPCYIRQDGKDKLIGAVAYGWLGQKEPLCGIQPIVQMLAVADLPGVTRPTTQPATQPATDGSASPGRGPAMGRNALIRAVLDPRKLDFSRLVMPPFSARSRIGLAGSATPRLAPLAIPLSISGSGRAVALLGDALVPAGIVPLQAGGLPAAQARAVKTAKLVPGGAIAVSLVTGDANYSAVGTVTDIIGGRLLAFGHSFQAQGQTKLPIGPAYVNTIVSTLMRSFKLASGLKVTGTLDRDERVGIAGQLGVVPAMIPMTVQVKWADLPTPAEHYRQVYSYKVVNHRWLTPLMVALLSEDAVWEWRSPPEEHTVRHWVQIDFKGLGRYEASNVTSGQAMSSAVSDAVRPVVAMLNNPFAKPPEITRIAVRLEIDKGTLAAEINDFKLDGRIYKPGDTVTGKLTVTPFRAKRQHLPVSFKLPADLHDGSYTLTACDYIQAEAAMQRDNPQKFQPRTVKQLFEAVQLAVKYKGNRLYLRLPLKRGGGLTIRHEELPDLPGSKTAILTQAKTLDTDPFTASLVRSVPSRYVLRGSASASFEVQTIPAETLVRQQ